MKTKFTPGPWTVVDGYYVIVHQNYEKKVIAIPTNEKSNPALNNVCESPAEFESIANANIIAASPELYEALRLAVKYLNKGLENGSFNDCILKVSKVIEIAEKALSKARGEI